MKLLLLIIIFLTSFAHAANIGDDALNLGDGNNASTDKALIFNDGSALASRKKISIDGTTKNLKSNSNNMELGDDVATGDKSIIFKRGGSNPAIKWNETLDRLEFSSNGSLYKAFGSGSGSGDGGVNLIDNSGFEDGISLEWTSSGGTFSQQSYTNATDNNAKFARFVASGAGQYFETTAQVIPDFLGAGCMADIKYYSATNNAFKIMAIDGSANTLAQQTLASNTSLVKSPTITFPCPAAAATVKLRVESLLAATIDADDGYIGGNKNLIAFSQASYFGGITTAGGASCTSNITSVFPTFTTFPAATCSPVAVGKALTVPNKSWAVKLPAGSPAGRYYFVQRNAFENSGSGSGNTCFWRANDGTTSSSMTYQGNRTASPMTNDFGVLTYSFTYNTALTSDVTIDVQAARDASPSCVISTGTNAVSEIEIYYFPSSSDQGMITSDQSSWFIDANIGGSNPSLGTGNVSSYTEIADASLDLVLNSGSAQAKIPCSSTNASTGLTCSVGNESVGLVFTPPTAGYYEVCAQFSHYMIQGGPAGSNSNSTFQLVETAPNAQTILQEGKTRINSGIGYEGASNSQAIMNPLSNCGTFYFASVSERAIRLMYEQAASGTLNGSDIRADRIASAGQRDMKFTVRPLLSPYNRPVLTGDQVTSPGVAAGSKVKTFSAEITISSGAITSGSEIGEWLSSCANVGAGTADCTVNAGIFTSANSYNCTGNSAVAGANAVIIISKSSPTLFKIQSATSQTGVINGTGAVSVNCHGL